MGFYLASNRATCSRLPEHVKHLRCGLGNVHCATFDDFKFSMRTFIVDALYKKKSFLFERVTYHLNRADLTFLTVQAGTELAIDSLYSPVIQGFLLSDSRE